jgi:hypothetical protein
MKEEKKRKSLMIKTRVEEEENENSFKALAKT